MSTTITTTVRLDSSPANISNVALDTAAAVRKACRTGDHRTVTVGVAPGHLQANLIVLPSKYADDFRRLCARNPVPCPLIAESAAPGRWDRLRSCVPGLSDDALVGSDGDFDVRTDLPAYNIYSSGRLLHSGVTHILSHWDEKDSTAFLIGCSFSFESALASAGLTPRHMLEGKNVPMYRTTLPLAPAGVFKGSTWVVSMRPYPQRDVEKVRGITRAFEATHGEPVDWGWDAVKRLGIRDLDRPGWGDAATSIKGGLLGGQWGSEDEVPVFWGCGVTPQEAVMRAGEALEGVVMAHQPGHMLVLDARDEDIVDR